MEVKHLWGMPPKNSGGWTKFPGGHKVIHRTAQTAFVRVVTPRNFTGTELNNLNVLFIFSKLSEKKVPCCVLTSSLIRRFPLFQRQVNGQAFTLRQQQVFETKHLQIRQFY